MDLRTWRQKQGLTLLELAHRLGIGGNNPSSQVSRIERGRHAVDALTAEKIVIVTNGQVSVLDLHNTRKAWMLENTQAAHQAEHNSAEAGA
ncbi:helix-turn-helix transcriptional regulator [Aurantimonas sp. DM33-3]|uniref:helix-turn-helix domain-containing protein n=1 Tax=Aurantimonas sp. DM33-3 TaxID=2766955 RepID=UPI001652B503|nr:helix-turn-helix transcriptional regulator [Aurantimonas sp. DM33-3]MBC6714737.1 helix-turn-helix transcriptional regulator [Aurantimonas sp. DM33-3]